MENNIYQGKKIYINWGVFLLISIVSFVCFSWLAMHVKEGKTFLVDEEGFAITFALRSYFLDNLMEFFTFLGSSTFLLPANIFLIIVILFYKKDKLFALQWTITAIISLLLMYFFKGMYQRARPLDPYLESAKGFSFPSGHTLNSTVFYGLIIFSLWRYSGKTSLRIWGTFLLTFIILAIGLSRIYLRVHYASDVLGGFALGISWLTVSICIFQFKKRNLVKNANSLKVDK